MIYIGCHLSVTDGYEAMGYTMSRFGGNTFAWFTRNPRGGRTKPVVQKKLLERVPGELLWPQVMDELFERDYNTIGDEIEAYRRR